MNWKEVLKSIVMRPEVISLLAAIIVTLVTVSGLAERAGLPLTEASVVAILSAFWAVVVGNLFEGGVKPDWPGGLAVLSSVKARAAYAMVVVHLLAAGLRTLGVEVPEEALATVSAFIVAAILGKAGVDVASAVQLRYKTQLYAMENVLFADVDSEPAAPVVDDDIPF